MKLSQIEYFLETAEHLNFTAAAKNLYISQPALSKQIALMEEELGIKLFLRNSRRVTLTAAGKQLQKDLKDIYRHLEQAQQRAIEISKNEKNIFRIACFDGAYVDDFLPKIYEWIHRLDPDLQLTLFQGSFDEIQKMLEQDTVDLMITLDFAFSPDDNYQIQPIISRKGSIIFSDDSPLARLEAPTKEDFAKEHFLVLHPSVARNLHGVTLKNLERIGIPNPSIKTMENFATLFTNLKMGHGYTILTEDVSHAYPHFHKFSIPGIEDTNIIAVWKKSHSTADILLDGFSME